MTDKREIEGIGYHYMDYGSDCLLVEQWTKRPDDLKGQALTMGKLLPQDIRRTDVLKTNSADDESAGPCKFKFRIIIEIERTA